jgi:hypothetical protein
LYEGRASEDFEIDHRAMLAWQGKEGHSELIVAAFIVTALQREL